jgi:chromosome segregation ATPase
MPRKPSTVFAAGLAFVLAAVLAAPAAAQTKGRIVCWKDKAGKVIGCGDKVPPEFEDSATKELDRRGVTRKTTETAEEQAKQAARDEAMAKQKEEDKKRLAEQQRRDTALLNTYANEKEIDQRRDREIQEVDRLLGQFEGLKKSATTRLAEAQKKVEAAEKARKPSDALKDEVARTEAEISKFDRSIATKQTEREEIRARYAQTKERYVALRGGAPSTAAVPAKK